MRKAGLITLAIIGLALFTSCSSSKAAGNGYFGVSNKKATQAQHKEFKKSKHKIPKSKTKKVRN